MGGGHLHAHFWTHFHFHFGFFLGGEGNFQWRVTGIDVAALAALRAMVKQHVRFR